jgi:uracil-DNA glycosylase family 4
MIDEIPSCEKCELISSRRKKIVKGFGDREANIFFIGLAPGRNGADITGVPFTRDPSGVLFQEAMIKAGFSLETDPRVEKPKLKGVFVTNIVKCNPKDDSGNNRAPTIKEIQNCISYLNKEIEIIQPKIIVLFGKIVTESILNRKVSRFKEVHNIPISMEGRDWIPFYHPSYVIRGSYNRQKYVAEICELAHLI